MGFSSWFVFFVNVGLSSRNNSRVIAMLLKVKSVIVCFFEKYFCL
jgi:hypothetical protein